MVNSISIKINNKEVQVPEGTRIIDACRDNGYKIPSLCFLKDINEIGACRICVVEVKGISHLVPSCNNTVQEGMEILTNSPRVREARKINAELLLSQHTVQPVYAAQTASLRELQTIWTLPITGIKTNIPKHYGQNHFHLSVTQASA